MSANLRRSLLILPMAVISAPALAQTAPAADADSDGSIIVTAARTELPLNALPMTIDVIDSQTLTQQVAIGGSVVDAVSALTPSFSPTRQKLSGAGETLRELGRETLVAQKQSTALDRELASKRALVASKRLDLFQSYLSSRASEGR